MGRQAIFRIIDVFDFAQALSFDQRPFFSSSLLLERIHLINEFQFLCDVGSPDSVRAFKHHMFEEVGYPGNSGAFIDRSYFGNPAGCNVWVTLARYHEQPHPIVQNEFLHGNVLPPQALNDQEHCRER